MQNLQLKSLFPFLLDDLKMKQFCDYVKSIRFFPTSASKKCTSIEKEEDDNKN